MCGPVLFFLLDGSDLFNQGIDCLFLWSEFCFVVTGRGTGLVEGLVLFSLSERDVFLSIGLYAKVRQGI